MCSAKNIISPGIHYLEAIQLWTILKIHLSFHISIKTESICGRINAELSISSTLHGRIVFSMIQFTLGPTLIRFGSHPTTQNLNRSWNNN
jgi:hypothetical protein